MADNFYEFQHKCDKMPDEIDDICKIRGSKLSQATIHSYIPQVGSLQATLYGWEFCPYCGKKLEG